MSTETLFYWFHFSTAYFVYALTLVECFLQKLQNYVGTRWIKNLLCNNCFFFSGECRIHSTSAWLSFGILYSYFIHTISLSFLHICFMQSCFANSNEGKFCSEVNIAFFWWSATLCKFCSCIHKSVWQLNGDICVYFRCYCSHFCSIPGPNNSTTFRFFTKWSEHADCCMLIYADTVLTFEKYSNLKIFHHASEGYMPNFKENCGKCRMWINWITYYRSLKICEGLWVPWRSCRSFSIRKQYIDNKIII